MSHGSHNSAPNPQHRGIRWTIAALVVFEFAACHLLSRLDSALGLQIAGPTPVSFVVDWKGLSEAVFRFDETEIIGTATTITILAVAVWASVPARISIRTSVLALAVIAITMLIISRILGAGALEMPILECVLIWMLICTDAIIRQRASQTGVINPMTPSIPTIVGVLIISAYSGLYLAETSLDISAALPITLTILALIALRVNYSRRLDHSRRTLRGHLVVTTIVLLLGAMLLLSYAEYSQGNGSVVFAPTGQPWRSQYFSTIVSLFMLLPCLWAIESGSTSVRRDRLPMVLTASMAIGVPFLTCFTPHGVLLLLSSSIWLIVAYIICRSRYLTEPRTEPGAVRFWCIIVAVLLFSLLAGDRLVYYSILRSIAPTMPVLALIPPVMGGILALISAFSESFRAYFVGLWTKITAASRNPRAGLRILADAFILSASVGMLLLYVIFYAVVLSALDTSGPIPQPTLGVPGLVGLFGLNALSWASVSYILYIVTLLLALGWTLLSAGRTAAAHESASE